jgi:hypothetical protein
MHFRAENGLIRKKNTTAFRFQGRINFSLSQMQSLMERLFWQHQ